MPLRPTECDLRLGEHATFTRLPPVAGPGECGGTDLLRLETVRLPGRSGVRFLPPVTLRCGMAEAVVEFVRQLAPAAAEFRARLVSIEAADSFSCRNRNHRQTAKISEHARANALDVGTLTLADRSRIRLADPALSLVFRERVRESACRYFTTVLGPGADAYHSAHVHLDRAERSRGYRLCQWELPPPAVAHAVPLPPARPMALRSSRQTAEGHRGQRQ